MIRFLTVLTAAALSCAAFQGQVNAVELVFLDVGQGDAIVVRSPEGNVALIDAGNDAEVLPLLEWLEITAIDLVIASHLDSDHIGGIEDVVRSIPVYSYMDNGDRNGTQSYHSMIYALRQAQVNYIEDAHQVIELGSVTLTILPPPNWGRSANNESIGVLVEYGDFKALLTGDSEVDELNYFLSMGLSEVTVLKAAHHGSRNGVTPRWVDVTRPQVVVIQAGANNAYGHPDPWALRYYEAVAAEIYRTDLNGNVAVFGYEDGTYNTRVERPTNGGSQGRRD